MRGKDEKITLEGMTSRITPAYAGKSCGVSKAAAERRDHPRLCGEKPIVSRNLSPGTGSPPPMRGKVESSPYAIRKDGITPAYAGKSSFASCSFASFRDHPRLCGEKITQRQPEPCGSGSPPPMRGKALKTMPKQRRCRITPAYAGKSETGRFHSLQA